MFLGLSTAAVLQDEYLVGLQISLTKHGVGEWQVPKVVSASVKTFFSCSVIMSLYIFTF